MNRKKENLRTFPRTEIENPRLAWVSEYKSGVGRG